MTDPEPTLDIDEDADDVEIPIAPAVPVDEPFEFKSTKKQTQRIDQFLCGRFSHLSRNVVQGLIEAGRVTVNGKPSKSSYKLKDGDTLYMMAPAAVVHELTPEDIPLEILYEDEHFLALNKQADLIVHPARGRWSGTLVNGLVHYGRNWSTVNGDWRPGILHRLDRNTTGVMLVAKSDEAHWRIARQFENRTIQKTYVAVVHGVPEFLADVIDMPIGKDKYVREKQAVRKEENGGRVAQTRYEVEAIYSRPPAGVAACQHVRQRPQAADAAGEVRVRSAQAQDRSHPPAARAHGGHRAPDGGRHDVRRANAASAGFHLRPSGATRGGNHLHPSGYAGNDDDQGPFAG